MKRLIFLPLDLSSAFVVNAQQQSPNLFELTGGMDIQISPETHKEFWNTGNAINDLELQLLDQSESIAGASKTSLTIEGGGGFRFYLTNSLGLSLETTLVANFLEGNTLIYLPIRIGVFFR